MQTTEIECHLQKPFPFLHSPDLIKCDIFLVHNCKDKSCERNSL